MTNAIQIKLFLGFHLNGEIKLFLNQSPLWKDSSLLTDQKLIQTRFENRDYIGVSLESPLLYPDLLNKENQLRNLLQNYCPKLNVEKQKIHLFPELFIS